MSRCASEQCQRPCGSSRFLICLLGILGGIADKASAQTETSAQASAASEIGQTSIKSKALVEPVIGQVQVKSPLSNVEVQNRPRFTITPSVRTVYDTNIFRHLDINNESRGNLRVTPGIDLDYSRLFGRVSLGVSGTAGYDYNSRFNSLNQSRVNISGTARAPVGAICSFKTFAGYERAAFDLNDTQTSNTSNGVGAVSTIINYGLEAGCKRESGFTPQLGISQQKLTNSRGRFFNNNRSFATIALNYSRPSLGTVSASATYTQLRRPFIAELTGFNDDTDVYSLTLGLNRAIAPRFRINFVGGMTKAEPRRNGVRSFLGASYAGRLDWLPSSRFTAAAIVARQVTSQNGISATYVIREDYTLTAGYKASAKSQFVLTGNRTFRDFRGESLTPLLEPLRADRVSSVSANYNYALTRRLKISFGASHRWRKADNPFYNYSSTVLSSSIGANF